MGIEAPRPAEGGQERFFSEDQIQAWRERVETMQRENDAKIQELARSGIALNPLSIAMVRLGELTEFLLGDMDSPNRLAYETRVQEKFQAQIDAAAQNAKSQAARAALMQGVNGAGGSGRPRNIQKWG